jgi:hypothetical protein
MQELFLFVKYDSLIIFVPGWMGKECKRGYTNSPIFYQWKRN